MSSSYRGSNAFNQIFSLEEEVNKSTGSFSLSKSLIDLPGVKGGIDLKLTLIYSPGTTGILGLPNNWIYDLPYVVVGSSLSLHGRSFVIDPLWSDATGYQSGLRYENNHGVLFQEIVPPQPLTTPGGTFDYAYTASLADGTLYFFDAVGKLLAQNDRFGNGIFYFYANDNDVYNNVLSSITDSWGQNITFAQMPGTQQTLTLPDGSSITVNQDTQGVVSIVDQLGQTTTLTYSSFANQSVVTQIAYPTGLATTLTYTAISGLLSDGSSVSLPAVDTITHMDASSNFLDQTSYAYGLNTGGCTFTGASAGYTMSSGADGLMDSNNMSYLYDISIQHFDGNGKLLASSVMYFNFLHLPMSTEEYLVQSDGTTNSARKIDYQYDIDPNQHARTPSFAMPVTVNSSDWSSDTNAFIPTQQQTATYDAFNQPLTRSLGFYDGGTQSFATQTAETYSYQNVTLSSGQNVEMPAASSQTDAVSGQTINISYVLTSNNNAVASKTSSVQTQSGGSFMPWKTVQYVYDNQGRITQQTTSWAKGAAQAPGVNNVSTAYAYAYTGSNHQGSVTVTDALGDVRVEYTRQDLPGAPVCKTIDGLGNITTMTSDAFGRLLTLTQPNGNVSTTIYQIWATNQVNQMQTTNPVGYVVATQFDALSRKCQVLDNGGTSSQPNSKPQRVVNQWQYDALGRVISITDIEGRVTTQQWDSLGRKTGTTDPLGNVYAYSYRADDNSMSTQLNGANAVWTQNDPQNRTLARQVFAIGGALNTLGFANGYNGIGDLMNETWTDIAQNGGSSQVLKSKTYSYNPDRTLTSGTLTGPDANGKNSKKTKSITRDLLNNPISWTKTVAYGNGNSYQYQGPVSAYDAVAHLVSVTNALGQVQTYQYNAADQMSGGTTFSGSTLSFAYDPVGNLLKMGVTAGANSQSVQFAYDALGRMISANDGTQALSIAYTLDGKTRQVTYPGNLSQSYVLDACSRVISSTDVAGKQTSYQYSSNGLLNTVSQGALTLTMGYGTAAGRKGMLVSQAVTANGTSSLNRSFSYDGLGRMNQQLTQGASANFKTAYNFDSLSRLTGISSQAGGDNIVTAYQYDGLDQLTSESQAIGTQPAVTTSYGYDGNYNVIASASQGQNTSYSYNAIDQLQLQGITYDANGNMLADGSGNKYAYDAWNRLVAITFADNSSLQYSYYPTGMLSQEVTPQKTSKFYQDGTQVNCAVESVGGQNQSTSFLLAQGARIAATPQGQDATYYETTRGSTTQLFGANESSFNYAAYGDRSGTTEDNAFAEFGWNQEYQSEASGLVYLRSRFYHPQLKRFLSYDQMPVDNRYAFGEGNPIDRIDPTGHISGLQIGMDVVGILIGIAGAIAAPFSGGSSAVIAAGVVGGILGAASSATALAAAATDNKAANIASWVLGGIGAIADIGSGIANVVGRAGASGAMAAERSAVSASAELAEGGTGAIPSQLNPRGLDDNCVYCTMGSMTGDSSTQTARILGRTEGIVATDTEISSMMVQRGLSRSGSVHSFDDLQSAGTHVNQYSRDDEYLVTFQSSANMRHAVHGYWNTFEGRITVFDAQQGRLMAESELTNAMPIRLWRAEGGKISRILNGQDHALDMMHLTDSLSNMKL